VYEWLVRKSVVGTYRQTGTRKNCYQEGNFVSSNHTQAKTKSRHVNKALLPWALYCWECHQQNVGEILQKCTRKREREIKKYERIGQFVLS
jgi:hypothetical protein